MANGIVSITLGLLKDMLMLPEEYAVTHVYYEATTGRLLLGVNHPDIPDVPEGGHLPYVTPSYTQKITEDGRMVSLSGISIYPSKGMH